MLNRALLVLISNLTVLVCSCLLDKTSIDQAVRHISYAGLQAQLDCTPNLSWPAKNRVKMPSVASKRRHETKKHVLIGCQA